MNILKLCLREVGEGAHFKRQLLLPGGCNFHMNFFWGSEVQGSTSYSENPYTPLLGHTKQSLPFLTLCF